MFLDSSMSVPFPCVPTCLGNAGMRMHRPAGKAHRGEHVALGENT
jgi:hypothetical protein